MVDCIATSLLHYIGQGILFSVQHLRGLARENLYFYNESFPEWIWRRLI